MRRSIIAGIVTTVSLCSACGGGGDGDDGDAQAEQEPRTSETGNVSSPSADGGVGPDYTVLSAADLTAALLTIESLPPGYSQDPPSEPSTKTFCDYEPPFTETDEVTADFTKGGGLSSEILRFGLRQYESPDQSRASFDALTQALSTCKGETYQGTDLTYTAMSTPQVGEDAVGVRITAGSTVLLQNFALIGPTIVAVGGGGLVASDADEVADLLVSQVDAYKAAAES